MSSLSSQLEQAINDLRGLKSAEPLERAEAMLKEKNLLLLKNKLIFPTPAHDINTLGQARTILELSAFISIYLKGPFGEKALDKLKSKQMYSSMTYYDRLQYVMKDSTKPENRFLDPFTSYYNQLQPFYLFDFRGTKWEADERLTITGLYMLQLLTINDYAGFHSLLEELNDLNEIEIQYPIALQQAMIEGSYDIAKIIITEPGTLINKDTSNSRLDQFVRTLKTSSRGVPEIFHHFSDILLDSVRQQIAQSSSFAYTEITLQVAATMFFYDLNDRVKCIRFMESIGWKVDQDNDMVYPQVPSQAGADEYDSDEEIGEEDNGMYFYQGRAPLTPATVAQLPHGEINDTIVNMLTYTERLDSIV